MKPIEHAQRKRKKRDATMRVGAGGVELVKRGASRYDFKLETWPPSDKCGRQGPGQTRPDRG